MITSKMTDFYLNKRSGSQTLQFLENMMWSMAHKVEGMFDKELTEALDYDLSMMTQRDKDAVVVYSLTGRAELHGQLFRMTVYVDKSKGTTHYAVEAKNLKEEKKYTTKVRKIAEIPAAFDSRLKVMLDNHKLVQQNKLLKQPGNKINKSTE